MRRRRPALGRPLTPDPVPGQYGWADLHRWRLALGGVFGFPGVTTLDTDERENRIVVGLSDLGASSPIIQWLSRIGVPREAVLFVYAPPAVPLY